MTPGRIVLMMAGLLVALGAALLVNRGIRGFSGSAASVADQGAEVEGGDEGTPLPEWQDFARFGHSETPVPRPAAGTDFAAVSPFESSQTRSKLEMLALRLDGVVPGKGGQDALAMISGQVMRIGDPIDDFRISKIDAFGVSLMSSTGVRVELGLGMSTAPPDVQASSEPLPRQASWQTPRRATAVTRFLPTVSRPDRAGGNPRPGLAWATRRRGPQAGRTELYTPLSELDEAVDRDAARRREELLRDLAAPPPQLPDDLRQQYERAPDRRLPMDLVDPSIQRRPASPPGGP